MEKHLSLDPEHATLYRHQIDNTVARGVARKITIEEMSSYDGPFYNISHHAVLKPESKSTPCRIVFNSSANFHGHVLNEYYAKGPDMLKNLLGVLMRFREEKVAFVGDISKMFHSIEIPLIDQMTHRFLWRDLDTSKEPDTYVMTAVNMGDRPSATIAIVALRKTAEMSMAEFPKASKSILSNSYMDDIPDSATSFKEAERVIKDIDNVLGNCGFKTKEWIMPGSTNKVSEQMTDNQQTVQLLTNTEASDDNSKKVLGMKLDPKRDVILYDAELNCLNGKKEHSKQPAKYVSKIPAYIPLNLTERQILSQVNGIYDPLGLISPFAVKAKIMLCKLWAQDRKFDWDEPIPETFRQEWIKFFQEFAQLKHITFERSTKLSDAVSDPILVVLSDGSGEAYGGVAYARWQLEDHTYAARLLTAKNRIAPIKVVDIVRLELAGVVVSKHLRVFIEEEMRYKFTKVYHIIDSEIVKAMINKESYGFNTFAANRIGEIQQKTTPSEWFWVEGVLNIADWITRGKSPLELDRDCLWQKGPDFLALPEEYWPITSQTDVVDLPERTKTISVAATDAQISDTLAGRINVQRFSKIELLINTTGRVLKLYRRYKFETHATCNQSCMSDVAVEDREIAEKFWIQDAQCQMKDNITSGKYVNLCPKNKDDIIVVGGRTERWMASTSNRQEFSLLPNNDRFSYLVAVSEHQQIGHLGVGATIARILSKFWIISICKLVKSIIGKCIKCKKKFKRLSSQVMGVLPLERLRPCHPFSAVGIDYFGPYTIKGEVQKHFRGKCYGVIFACMTSRAVHVDVSQDYSTDAFLQVLRRFSSLSGWPKKIFSDNGEQLVAASKKLCSVVKGLDCEFLQKYGVKYGTEWQLFPADALWYNSATESLVKTVKRALNAAVEEQIMTFRELQTVMYEAADIVNQRPIGTHQDSPEDSTYLSTNYLILGRSSSHVPQSPFLERVSSKYRFDYIQGIVGRFWKKWTWEVFS